ncbi:hypothetical protein LTR37_009036 [Vermiconidia calcicola]|uniref:Uncharacterized protein n=1 Tax=Vermiconidia calcicola TaxID=1690605 RepID=A0ACC3NAM8_9PEZI|nr:hypothetical protein LTR37_009036 [Vermiconidia calcicola]
MDELSRDDGTPHRRQEREHVCLYDAIAGRAGFEGFLSEPQPSKYRDTVSTSHAAVPPEEVLFRRAGAPARYEEDDIYITERHLLPSQRLPDSDLLKALHTYASDYYAAATGGEGKDDFKSLDETALLALGILLEEAAHEALGETGDLALVEAADDEEHVRPNVTKTRTKAPRPKKSTKKGKSQSMSRVKDETVSDA